jgi:hypothetical protein
VSSRAAIPEDAVQLVRRYAAEKAPPELADEFRLDVDVRGTAVILAERRPPRDPEDGPEWTSTSVARFRWSEGRWSLYWPDRNGRWHRDEHAPDTSDLQVLLDVVDADPTGIFWG